VSEWLEGAQKGMAFFCAALHMGALIFTLSISETGLDSKPSSLYLFLFHGSDEIDHS